MSDERTGPRSGGSYDKDKAGKLTKRKPQGLAKPASKPKSKPETTPKPDASDSE